MSWPQEHAEMIEWITLYDWIIGTVFVVGWVLGHAAILLMLRKEGLASGSWKESWGVRVMGWSRIEVTYIYILHT